MPKDDFFTYHKSYAGLILAFHAGNPVRYTEKQFSRLHSVTLNLNGVDYSIGKDKVTKLR